MEDFKEKQNLYIIYSTFIQTKSQKNCQLLTTLNQALKNAEIHIIPSNEGFQKPRFPHRKSLNNSVRVLKHQNAFSIISNSQFQNETRTSFLKLLK